MLAEVWWLVEDKDEVDKENDDDDDDDETIATRTTISPTLLPVWACRW